MEIYHESILFYISLFFVHIFVGRKASFPYAIIAGMSPVKIGILAVIFDLILMIAVHFIIAGALKLKVVEKLWENIRRRQDRGMRSKAFGWLYGLGTLGVILSVALPMTGGIYTGMTISQILGMKRWLTCLMIFIGSILGSIIFVLSALGVMELVG